MADLFAAKITCEACVLKRRTSVFKPILSIISSRKIRDPPPALRVVFRFFLILRAGVVVSIFGKYVPTDLNMNENTIQGIREALKHSPDNIPLRMLLAENLLSLNRLEEAEAEYTTFLRTSSDLRAKQGLARV